MIKVPLVSIFQITILERGNTKNGIIKGGIRGKSVGTTVLDLTMKAPHNINVISPLQCVLPVPVPPSQHTMPSQPIDITLEEVSRPSTGGSYSQVKGCVTFQNQSLVPDGFPTKWIFKTSPPIAYMREILFPQSDPNQYENTNIHDAIYGEIKVCNL